MYRSSSRDSTVFVGENVIERANHRMGSLGMGDAIVELLNARLIDQRDLGGMRK
jgi:hypothetical protein